MWRLNSLAKRSLLQHCCRALAQSRQSLGQSLRCGRDLSQRCYAPQDPWVRACLSVEWVFHAQSCTRDWAGFWDTFFARDCGEVARNVLDAPSIDTSTMFHKAAWCHYWQSLSLQATVVITPPQFLRMQVINWQAFLEVTFGDKYLPQHRQHPLHSS